ncbi:hypothetical protein GCM10009531_83670 [Actinoplanes capillaceus]
MRARLLVVTRAGSSGSVMRSPGGLGMSENDGLATRKASISTSAERKLALDVLLSYADAGRRTADIGAHSRVCAYRYSPPESRLRVLRLPGVGWCLRWVSGDAVMASATVVGLHRALRPGWDCEDCGRPWPCPPRRVLLLVEYGADRLALLLFLAALMAEAIDDFHRYGAGPVPDLLARFLGWARRAEPSAALSETAGVVSLPP